MSTRPRDTLILLISSTALGLAIGALCAWAGGRTLGAFMAPLALLAPVVPQLAGRHRSLPAGAGATSILCLAITATWCIVGAVNAAALIRPTLVLAGWSFILWALTAALIRRPRPRRGVLRAAAVTIAAWLWLGFPIWLGPTLAECGADVPLWLSAIHPLLAMNTAVIELGIWTQQPIAYQLTPLGQDVAYALPRTIWPFVLFHVLAALALILIRKIEPRRHEGTLMWKQYLNLAVSVSLLGALGFMVPLTFVRRSTLTGLLTCLATFALAGFAAAMVGQRLGMACGIITWGAINVLIAAGWIRLVLFITAKQIRDRPAA